MLYLCPHLPTSQILLQGRPIQVKRTTSTYIRLSTQGSSDCVLRAKLVGQKAGNCINIKELYLLAGEDALKRGLQVSKG